jgi:hypothetical protein
MQARAHLKLIVCEPANDVREDEAQDRLSMVQPVSNLRLRQHWLRANASVLALWCASVLLLSLAALVAFGAR